MPDDAAPKADPAPALKLGLFGIGLDTYWPQFDGLKERLAGYLQEVESGLAQLAPDAELINAGLVDDPARSAEAGRRFAAEDVDMLFLFVSTYALSSTVLPVVQRANKPVVVLNLQPAPAINYAAFNAMGDRGKMTGEWLAHCQACSAPEIACVFNRAGIAYHLVTGTLHDDPVARGRIRAWVEAARVHRRIADTRIGLMGHYYNGMLDIYSDLTQLAAVFGHHWEIVEMCELHALRTALADSDVNTEIAEFRQTFDVDPACSEPELRRAAATSAALHQLVDRHRLGAMAYYYEGQPGNPYEDIVASVIAGNTRLTAAGVPVAGEYEVKNVLAMKIMDALGAGGSFSEFYGMDFDDDVVMLGHDGPGHAAIAQERVRLVPLPLYHGKPGQGLSIQMRVKLGPVTYLSVVQDVSGQVKLLFAEGQAVDGPVLDIGNTNGRYRFGMSVRDFVDRWCEVGPAHHGALGIGHHGDTLTRLASLLGIPAICIT